MLDYKVVSEEARGRWLEVYQTLAPELAESIARFPRHGPCPRHGGTDGFRLFKDAADTGGAICNTCGTFSNGYAVLQWLHGWTFRQCVDEIGEFLGVDAYLSRFTDASFTNDESARLRLQSVWWAAGPDTGLIANYLRSRGLSGEVPRSLRLHPGLDYFSPDGVHMGTFPCMCAPVQRALDGDMVSIHRTYLAEDGMGKADVPQPKKLMRAVYPGATRGAAVRLAPVEARICVTEGIETALAVQEHTLCTTLAAVSANGLEVFQPPPGVRTVEIWADNDVSGAGQRSSAIAKRHLVGLGYSVVVKMPPKAGTDWLDELFVPHS